MKIQKGLMIVVAILFFLAFGMSPAVAQMACEDLATLTLPYATVTSAQSVPAGTYVPPDGGFPVADLPDFCLVSVKVEPQINIEIWMPAANWNNRYQAIGNGGNSGSIGMFRPMMGNALRNGYATSATDNGHQGNISDGSFGLYPDGTLNWQLIEDFASRSLHEQAVKPKAVIEAFYGSPPIYSYFWGGSTGGRQGIMLAQAYGGQDYDGIHAGCPAINWDRFTPAELWPQVVMNNDLGYVIPECKLTAVTAAAITACDGLDGIMDGVIDDPRRCTYDAQALQSDTCTQTDCTCLTPKEALAVNKIWDGPTGTDGSFLWYGLEPGTALAGLPYGGLAGAAAMGIGVDHFRYWIKKNPAFDWKTLTYADFERDFKESVRTFNDVIGTDNPDLSGFRSHGGKIVIWHGWVDSLIFAMGTVDYYERVLNQMGGIAETQKFARLFMAPGVDHCNFGPGPNVFDAFAPLVDWVEKGIAPDKIIATKYVNDNPAQGVLRTRPLCVYPQVARYTGTGSTDDAASFVCATPVAATTVKITPAKLSLSRKKTFKASLVVPKNFKPKNYTVKAMSCEGATPVNGKVKRGGNNFSATFNTEDLKGKIAGTEATFMVDISAEYNGEMVVFQGSTTIDIVE